MTVRDLRTHMRLLPDNLPIFVDAASGDLEDQQVVVSQVWAEIIPYAEPTIIGDMRHISALRLQVLPRSEVPWTAPPEGSSRVGELQDHDGDHDGHAEQEQQVEPGGS